MSPVILKPSSSLWEWDTLKKRKSFCHTMLNLNSRVYKRYFNNIQIYQLRQQNETRITRQVTWLVVTEVRSESFGLVAECRHYNGHPISIYHSAPLLGQFYLSSSSVVPCAFSALTHPSYHHHNHIIIAFISGSMAHSITHTHTHKIQNTSKRN